MYVECVKCDHIIFSFQYTFELEYKVLEEAQQQHWQRKVSRY